MVAFTISCGSGGCSSIFTNLVCHYSSYSHNWKSHCWFFVILYYTKLRNGCVLLGNVTSYSLFTLELVSTLFKDMYLHFIYLCDHLVSWIFVFHILLCNIFHQILQLVPTVTIHFLEPLWSCDCLMQESLLWTHYSFVDRPQASPNPWGFSLGKWSWDVSPSVVGLRKKIWNWPIPQIPLKIPNPLLYCQKIINCTPQALTISLGNHYCKHL